MFALLLALTLRAAAEPTGSADAAGGTGAEAPPVQTDRSPALAVFGLDAAAIVWCSDDGNLGPPPYGSPPAPHPLVRLGPSRLVGPAYFVYWAETQEARGMPVDTSDLLAPLPRRSHAPDLQQLSGAVRLWNIWLLAQLDLDVSDLGPDELAARASPLSPAQGGGPPWRAQASISALPTCP